MSFSIRSTGKRILSSVARYTGLDQAAKSALTEFRKICPIRLNSVDFFEGEFTGKLSIGALCQAIKADNLGIKFKTPDNTIERLNEILETVDLYEIIQKTIRTKGAHANKDSILPTQKVTAYLNTLRGATYFNKADSYKEMNKDQQLLLKLCNRIILETVYYKYCPRLMRLKDLGKPRSYPISRNWIKIESKISAKKDDDCGIRFGAMYKREDIDKNELPLNKWTSTFLKLDNYLHSQFYWRGLAYWIPAVKGSGWLRISANSAQACYFQRGWESRLKGEFSIKYKEEEYVFTHETWAKLHFWFSSSSYERKGTLVGEKRDGKIHIIDFIPTNSIVRDPNVFTPGYQLVFTLPYDKFRIPYLKMPDLKKEIPLPPKKENEVRINCHSHTAIRGYPYGPSDEDRSSFGFMYDTVYHTAFLYDSEVVREIQPPEAIKGVNVILSMLFYNNQHKLDRRSI